ncbi:MAG TPA: amidohydrolase family protein [Propionibacteriaceae bacterium]|nr:amidohydrolase family protein [Propionibacteriaceae bacterium]
MTTRRVVIDAHQHFWDPSSGGYPWLAAQPAEIQRPYGFADLASHLASQAVDGTVLVQADDTDADTDAMFEVAAAHVEVLGVVAYVPLEHPDRAAERLAELQHRPGFVGIRNLIHDQADPDWLLRPDVAEGLQLLEQEAVPFELVTNQLRHLEHVGYLSERFPRLRLVVDHLGKPPVKTANREPWSSLIRRAASNPLVHAKISGLYPAVGPWRDHRSADLRPWIDVALEAFGPQRLMAGSDWPVCVLAGGYDAVWSNLRQVLVGYGEEVSTPILGQTAHDYYGLAQGS